MEFSQHYGTRDGLEIRKLQMHIHAMNWNLKVQMQTLGQRTSKPYKVILLVGATGAGKTTLINAMVNYIYRVEFTDNYRLILTDDQGVPTRSQAESQTDMITAYVFYNLPGMPFDYNYVLIDTPGFGDTRGIQWDQEILNQLKNFLLQGYGFDQVHAVGFVTSSSNTRLTQTQRYVYDGLSSMFGKDVEDNIFIMATFADVKKPPVLEALQKAGIHFSGFYKFNNSALYASNTECGNDCDDEDNSVYITKVFWQMVYKNMNNFFKKLSTTLPVYLALTKRVLMERDELQLIVTDLQSYIHTGLETLTTLEKERAELARLDAEITELSNYTQEVNIPKITKIELKPMEHVTNCIKCSTTCHYPCSTALDEHKWRCGVIKNNHCQKCPGRCHWSVHKTMSFRYVETWKKEHRIIQERLNHYRTAQSMKLRKCLTIDLLEVNLNRHTRNLVQKIKKAQHCLDKLEDIALKPNPLCTKEYINLMIESEKMQKTHNYQKRIKILEERKEQVAIVQGLKVNCNTYSEEALLKHFHTLMLRK